MGIDVMSESQNERQRPAERWLKSATREGWASVAAGDLLATLADHAHCEKKASASAIALINDYPEDDGLVRAMARLAEEEIGHFREVFELLLERRAVLPRDRGDPYARRLLGLMRQPAEQRFGEPETHARLDQLSDEEARIVAELPIEARIH